MKGTGTLLLALFLGVCFASHCEATVYHSDGSAANVQYIHNTQAVDGDAITLPAGTFSWSSSVSVSKAITIQGQTTTDIPNGTANDQTIIVDNLVRQSSNPFFRFTATTGQEVRLSGITFSGVGGASQVLENGAIAIGTSIPFRIDHCHFT